ncbi:MAG: hypothetical protein HYX27_15950 [Acidobacteria bacterium]|nr:hypothetical protein [Acidobacteriota bacterium]
MSVNRHQDHLQILPEDDANRQIARGFALHQGVGSRRYQVLPEAGGWRHVLEAFEKTHQLELRRLPCRHLVLLIDFDGDTERREYVNGRIPADLRDRVFVLGVWSEPERLKVELGRYEDIGALLAKECHNEGNGTWSHPLLQHNAGELARLRDRARPFLFT